VEGAWDVAGGLQGSVGRGRAGWCDGFACFSLHRHVHREMQCSCSWGVPGAITDTNYVPVLLLPLLLVLLPPPPPHFHTGPPPPPQPTSRARGWVCCGPAGLRCAA
jgi:hypothetical protein